MKKITAEIEAGERVHHTQNKSRKGVVVLIVQQVIAFVRWDDNTAAYMHIKDLGRVKN